MSAVAPLVGSTPRTVKRYVNTYRLLKARAQSRPAFTEPASGIADREVVAFLLAIVTGQPELAAVLLPALTTATPGASLDSVLTGLTFIEGGALAPALNGALAQVRGWLDTNTAFKTAPATRFALSAAQIARFSFIPAVAFPGLADGGTDPV